MSAKNIGALPIRWLQEWRTGGSIDFRIGRDGDDLVAEWPAFGELRARRLGGTHRFTPCPGVDPARAEKFSTGAVRALLRHLEGRLSLHASAAARDGVAGVFLGPSISGKSTLVADLCRRPGFE